MRNALIAKVKMGQKQLGMSKEEYRCMLGDLFGVSSCTELKDGQLLRLIDHLQSLGAVYTSKKRRKKAFIIIDPKSPFAREKRRILALWNALGWKVEGIHSRCKTQFGVDRFQDLNDSQAIQTLNKDLTNRAARKGVLE